jgi:energy-coupling factor transport system ATP-binding protein
LALRLRVEDVSYSYPLPGRQDAAALNGISVTLEPGEVFCVAGANGSGKSTLAQVCAGLLAPSSGSIAYGEKTVKGRGDLLDFRRQVGLLFQSPEDQLFADTAAKDIAFGPRNHGLRGAELSEAVKGAAALVDLSLEEFGSRSPFSLSEGEKRRVALAGVLALNPDVLILDEPFIGLDYEGRERLKDTLTRYNREREASIMIVTHELSDVWHMAARFALLSEGRLLRVDRKSDMLSGELDLSALGMRLPQWGVLAREILRSGIPVSDPSDPAAIARAIATHREVRGGR